MPGKKPDAPRDASSNRLLTVCRLLNKRRARYVVVGGFACNLHGLIRGTVDVDLLIPKDKKNTGIILMALGELPLGLARELDATVIAQKPITIIGDMPRVDLLTVAGKVKFDQAIKTAKRVRIQGVWIPFVDIQTLIQTKHTDRLQDMADIERLKQILGI